MTSELRQINISEIDAHPNNPRLVQREDVIEAIKTNINGHGFDPAFAVLVRPKAGRFEIISGHHRHEAAKRAGVPSVAAWVREMDDATAYMELVKSNAQGELTALERGLHALHSGMSINAYADSVGRARRSVHNEVQAASVMEACAGAGTGLSDYFSHLTEIHAAPRWLWPALVEKIVADPERPLSFNDTRRLVADHKSIPEPLPWLDAAAIARALVSDEMREGEITKIGAAWERAHSAIEKAAFNADRHRAALDAALAKDRPARLAQVLEICKAVLDAQADEIAAEHEREAQLRESELSEQRQVQERERRISGLRANVSLEAWKELDEPTKALLLDTSLATGSASFNEQKTDAIEWAQWSWNPVTGCEHICPYCYAREIAQGPRMEKLYPHGFRPAFRPNSLVAPSKVKVPDGAEADTRFRNVFTCSMSDLFGKWVPREWIGAVLQSVRENPQWNFLFLTKFPQRFSEFDIPANAWMGTTVDLQARVKNAEKAFSKLSSGVRWLSIEPMLEPLKFERLDLFQWMVIGGSTPSRSVVDGKEESTPEWKPPFEWIADLTAQAKAAGVKVYQKTNLLGSRVLELPFDAPIKGDPQQAPSVFHYLGKAKKDASLGIGG